MHRPGSRRPALTFALAQVGKPYTFFTSGPADFDCSGLTLAAYAQIGVSLVHHAATQAQQGTEVDFWNHSIRAGDLVFLDGDWDGQSTTSASPSARPCGSRRARPTTS